MQISFKTSDDDNELYVFVPLARYEQLITVETLFVERFGRIDCEKVTDTESNN